MLKPRAEIEGDRKVKPKENRVVSPKFLAREIKVEETLRSEKYNALKNDLATGKIKTTDKAYKKREAAAMKEVRKKAFEFLGIKDKKYTPAQQARNAQMIVDKINSLGKGNRARRDKAFIKSVLKRIPASATAGLGAKGYKKVLGVSTRAGKGAKGGGKVRKGGKRGVYVTTPVTEKSGKTTRTFKDGTLRQVYAEDGNPKGAANKGGKPVRQYDTKLRNEGAAPRGAGAKKNQAAKPAPKAKEKAKPAKADTNKPKKGETAQKPKKGEATQKPKKGEQATPAKKQEPAKPRITPEAQRLMDAAAARRAGQGQAKPAPAAKPANKPAAKPAAKPDDGFKPAPKDAQRTTAKPRDPTLTPEVFKPVPVKQVSSGIKNPPPRGNTSQARKKVIETNLKNHKLLEQKSKSGQPMTDSDRKDYAFLTRIKGDMEQELKSTKWQRK